MGLLDMLPKQQEPDDDYHGADYGIPDDVVSGHLDPDQDFSDEDPVAPPVKKEPDFGFKVILKDEFGIELPDGISDLARETSLSGAIPTDPRITARMADVAMAAFARSVPDAGEEQQQAFRSASLAAFDQAQQLVVLGKDPAMLAITPTNASEGMPAASAVTTTIAQFQPAMLKALSRLFPTEMAAAQVSAEGYARAGGYQNPDQVAADVAADQKAAAAPALQVAPVVLQEPPAVNAPAASVETGYGLLATLASMPLAADRISAGATPKDEALLCNAALDLAILQAREDISQGVAIPAQALELITSLSDSETVPERLERIAAEAGFSMTDPDSEPVITSMKRTMSQDPRGIAQMDEVVTAARAALVAIQSSSLPVEKKFSSETAEEFMEAQSGIGSSWRDTIITCGDKTPDAHPAYKPSHDDLLEKIGFPKRPKLWPVMMAWPPQSQLRILMDAGADKAKMDLFHQGLMELQKRMMDRAEKLDVYIRDNNVDHDFTKGSLLRKKKPVELAMADPYNGIRWALLLDESQTKRSLDRIVNMSQSKITTVDGGRLIASMDAVRVQKFSQGAMEIAMEEAAARGWGTIKISADVESAKVAIMKAKQLGIQAEISIRGGNFGLFTKTVTVMPPPPKSADDQGLAGIMSQLALQNAEHSKAIEEIEKKDKEAIAIGAPVMTDPSDLEKSPAAKSYTARARNQERSKGPAHDEVPEIDSDIQFS